MHTALLPSTGCDEHGKKGEVLFSNSVLLTPDLNIADINSSERKSLLFWECLIFMFQFLHSVGWEAAATKGCFKKWHRDLPLRNLHVARELSGWERGKVFGWPFPSATAKPTPQSEKEVCMQDGQDGGARNLLPLLRLEPLQQEGNKAAHL